MSPKSSEVAEEDNTCREIADPPSRGKRKAESEEVEEEDGDQECEPSEEEREPVWGYDSFEERDYFSFSEDELTEAFSDDVESVRPFLDCRRQVHLSRGFEVDPKSIPKDMITGYFIDLNDTLFGWPGSPDGTARGYMERMVALAPHKYKEKQVMDVKMDHVVRAIGRKSAGIKCYITFMAQETPNGPLVEYQVHTYPIFCRPSPPPVDLKDKARRSTRIRPNKKKKN